MRRVSMTSWRVLLPTLWLMFGMDTGLYSRSNGSNTGQVQQENEFRFEVVSIRPHQPGTMPIATQFTPDTYAITASLSVLIMTAYSPQDWHYWRYSRIQNAPAWVTNEKYDVQARVAEKDMAAWKLVQDRDSDLLRSALRAVLNERCGLTLHISRFDIPYLDLVVDKHGTKLTPTAPESFRQVPNKTARLGAGFYVLESGQRRFAGVSMEDLSIMLTNLSQSYPVQDKTSLAGAYDFLLPFREYSDYPTTEIPDAIDRMPLTGIGLRLRKGTGPAFSFDIDTIRRPDAN